MNPHRAVSAVLMLAGLSGRVCAGDDGVLFEVYGTPTRLACSPAGSIVAATDSRRNIVLWSIAVRKRLREIDQAGGDGRVLAFSPNGSLLAASSSTAIRIWDVAARKEPASLIGHNKQVVSIDFSGDGTRLASLGSDGTLIVWNVDRSEEVFQKQLVAGNHGQAAFRPNGTILVAGAKDRLIQVWELRDEASNLVAQWDHRDWDVGQLSFSPERQRLALAVERESSNLDDNDQIHLWI